MRAVLALALALAACGPAPSGLVPDAAYQAATEAVDAGDLDRALHLLDEAGEAGHLESLRRLTHAYRSGELRLRDLGGSTVLYLDPPERRQARYQAVYDRTLASAIDAGDVGATVQAAKERLGLRWAQPDRSQLPVELHDRWDAADLDSARALRDRIDAASLVGRERLDLAHLNLAVGDSAAALALYDQAIADGDPDGCVLKVFTVHGVYDPSSASGIAAYLDQMAACAPDVWAEGTTRPDGLRATARSARSAEVLDSLATLGVFDRYPALATSAR